MNPMWVRMSHPADGKGDHMRNACRLNQLKPAQKWYMSNLKLMAIDA